MKKFIVVGYGSIAKKHISKLKELFPDSIITVSRSSEYKAKENLPSVDHVVGPIENIDTSGFDAAFICSPAPFHTKQIQNFTNNNIDIFCEKPLSHNMENLDEMKSLVESKDIHFDLGYVLRNKESLKEVKRIISTNEYGKVLHVSVDMGQYLPTWRKDSDYKLGVTANKNLGGGVTLELSHEIDYLIWLFGMPSSVVALESTLGDLDIDVEDTTDVMFGMNGFNIFLHLDMLQKKTTRRLKVVFEKCNLVWDCIADTIEVESDLEEISYKKEFEPEDIFIAQTKKFLSKESAVSIEEGINVMKIVEAIKSSSDKKVIVQDAW